jgi:hypothetical protein
MSEWRYVVRDTSVSPRTRLRLEWLSAQARNHWYSRVQRDNHIRVLVGEGCPKRLIAEAAGLSWSQVARIAAKDDGEAAR